MGRQAPTARRPAAAPNNTHLAGEFFVAAELAKRGYSVSLTMGNAKAVDLFAERNGKAVCVQVKAIARRQNSGWPLPHDKNKILSNVVYVCVIINDVGEAPTYFVVPPKAVKRLGDWYSTRAVLTVGKLRRSGFLDAWSLIDQAIETPASSPVSRRRREA